MPKNIRAYRVFIASPGGLESEREKFRDVLDEWNETFCLDRGIAFYPIGWEDTLPGKGRPQSIINTDVLKSDFLILLLWDRWGTPPGGDGAYTSGTEEEFRIAEKSIDDQAKPMRQIVVLFKGVDPRQLNDPGEQLQKVLAFKKRLEEEKSYLFGSFDTPEEFGKFLLRQVWAWASDLEKGGDGKLAPPPGGPIIPLTRSEPDDSTPKSHPSDKAESTLAQEAQELADEGRLADAEAKFATAILKEPASESFLRYGIFLRRVGRLEQGLVILTEALRIAGASDDEQGVAQAYNNLGLIHRRRGELAKAEEMHRKSLEIDQRLDWLEGMAGDYCNLGLIYRRRGDLAKAELMQRKSLEINEKLCRLEGIANVCGNLGVIYQERGDLDQAEQMFSKVLQIEERLGRLDSRANAYGNLGVIQQLRGKLEKAEALQRESLEINEKLGRLEGIANAYGNLGLINASRGDLSKAEEMHHKSLQIDEKLGRLESMALTYGNLGTVARERGDLAEVCELWTKARDLYQKIGMPHMVERAQGWLDRLPPDDPR